MTVSPVRATLNSAENNTCTLEHNANVSAPHLIEKKVISNVVLRNADREIKIGSTTAKIKILQVDFYKTSAGENMLNSIISVNLDNVIKQVPDSFPYSLIKNK